nr:MAG TPA: hypothetical protein [Caudoviricetes sp.]
MINTRCYNFISITCNVKRTNTISISIFFCNIFTI